MRRRLFLALLLAAGPSAALAADREQKMVGGVSFVPVETVVGATFRLDGRRGVLSVECGLSVPDAGLRERAKQSMPRLRSAFGSSVQTYAAGLPPSAPPNVDYLARVLQEQTDRILGRRGARVLLGAVLVN